MATHDQYPFAHHPCFSSTRENLWTRIHLPVAAQCNVKCVFCDQDSGTSCHTSKPGYSSRLMTPDEAIERVVIESTVEPRLRIVAISGPGEPLANDATFSTIRGVLNIFPEARFCISTNGTLLTQSLEKLYDLNISTISVSMSTQSYDIAAQLYEWANIDGHVLRGIKMGKEIVKRQISGIQSATDAGICVKVNTILIPGVNDGDMESLSRCISNAGAQLQNIVPLVSHGEVINLRPPSATELTLARADASKNIDQFTHCKQCRSDVVGIPGEDRVL
ncbi:MAG: radical SAM protein [Candidatus Thorarchaeota archaeon]|nr:radical SAM protein [Candidatus Thorarchaeota archaeon]